MACHLAAAANRTDIMRRSLLLAFAFALPLGMISPSFAASGDGSSAGGSAGTTNETNATTPNKPKTMSHTTHKTTHTAQKTSNPMTGGATSTLPPGNGPAGGGGGSGGSGGSAK
jgi:hypothetical protein